MSLFESLTKYSKDQEIELKTKLIKKLSKYRHYLIESLKSADETDSGYITFLQLRKILDNMKINLKDELIEFLIFLMKSFVHDASNSLDQLKYSVNNLNLI